MITLQKLLSMTHADQEIIRSRLTTAKVPAAALAAATEAFAALDARREGGFQALEAEAVYMYAELAGKGR